MMYQDRTLTCRDCNREFTFTVSEQEFHAEKGFTNDPGRCPECRAARRAQRGDTGYSSSGGYMRREREMFPAVCAQCGKATQVPFQPRTDRPVYCSDCYSAHRPAGGGYERRGGGGRSW